MSMTRVRISKFAQLHNKIFYFSEGVVSLFFAQELRVEMKKYKLKFWGKKSKKGTLKRTTKCLNQRIRWYGGFKKWEPKNGNSNETADTL